jgi:hypothetical protein
MPNSTESAHQQLPLTAVADDRRAEQARQLRSTLFQHARVATAQMGEGIGGFALVVWDREGNLRSAYDTSHGPIRAPLLPRLVADALNRHVAVMIAASRDAEDT